MRALSTDKLATLLGGVLDMPRTALVYGFATDHREVKAGDAFIAIKGAKFDGHEFAADAVKNGAVVVVAERPVSAPHIIVPNLVQSLADFAETFRNVFCGPVIGVTGSAGKTTTKEFLAVAVESLGKVLKTVGNRNTEYTAPLMWAELEPDTSIVIVEMAMRGFGQIAQLASFSKPTIGIVTNIGYGHMEMVGSREGIAKAKAELISALPSDGTVILWAEDEFLGLLREAARDRLVRTFGFSDSSDCRITDYRQHGWTRSTIKGELDGHTWSAELPVIGKHIALNAAAAVLGASVVGVPPADAASRLHLAKLPPLRMEVRQLNGASILLDTYNASPPALIAALDALLAAPVEGRRVAVVGEMKELGEHGERLHREIGSALSKLDAVLFYGQPMRDYALPEARKAGLKDARVANSIEDVTAFLDELSSGDVALVKGSRALELERALEKNA